MTDHRAEDAVEAAEESAREIVHFYDSPEISGPHYHEYMRHVASSTVLNIARAYLDLLSRVEEVRKEERERCAEAAKATATGFRQEQLTWTGPLNKESRDCCAWRHDGAKAAEMAIRSLAPTDRRNQQE